MLRFGQGRPRACAELTELDLSTPWYCRSSAELRAGAAARIAAAMGLFHGLVGYLAPLFIITSPITSYADQIYSIHKTRSSAGFSMDIPLIMLVASILKLFYWNYARFAASLLIQAIIMIGMQTMLLHVGLVNRPSTQNHRPFAGQDGTAPFRRPYSFWQWRERRNYWHFLGYMTATLLVLQVLFGRVDLYNELLGWVALAVEATLPIPQVVANHQRRCCKGFRPSVLVNWLVGDTFKLTYFFFAAGSGSADGKEAIPWAFKACGLFQASCDAYLGVQYFMYGNEEPADSLSRSGWEKSEK